VVTGLGIVSACGTGLDAFWSGLVAPGERPTPGLVDPATLGAVVTEREAKRMDVFSVYALAAAAEALTQAGGPDWDPTRVGVVLGNVYGAMPSVVEEVLAHDRDDGTAPRAAYGVLAIENAPASHLAARHGYRGPTKVVVGACAGGAYAIGDAAALIRSGTCDAVLTGAAQGPPTAHLEASYRALRVLSSSGYLRPFDTRRDGFVFSDGAAILVLESAASAEARGAMVLGEVLGAANTNDGAHMVAPSGHGAVECLRAGLADAGLAPDAITHVNAHGTGTAMNDLVEAEALLEVFGRPGPPVTSTKRVTGHASGAAGAFEAIAVLLAMARGVLPPVSSALQPDPRIELDLVVDEPRPWVPGPAVSTSFGLGGTNGCLVLGPPR
jgi:3-oxoacyl-[acyl-carrier-protein] synthase II